MKKVQDLLITSTKVLILSGILLLVVFSLGGFAQEVVLDRNPYKLVQIMVPGAEYDDDGTRFTRFPGYVIYNEEGEDILQLPSCLHSPFTIRMLPGTYQMEAVIEGKKIKTSFEVAQDVHFQQFDWPSLEASPDRIEK